MQKGSNLTSGISLKNVYKSYVKGSSKWAVRDFSLEIKPKEFFCLIGPSGCGKSTLLKLILGLEKPSQGEISKPSHIGMVFQSGALLPWLTAEENVAFGLKFTKETKHEQEDAVSKYIEMVGLSDFRRKYPRELSGGQRQRIGIARALAIDPEILLLDEPFSALDAITADKLHKTLIKIWEKTQITIVMVSHILEEAVFLADRVGIMKDGSLLAIDSINMKRPRNSESEKFEKTVNNLHKMLD